VYLLLINISISGFLLVCGGVSDWDLSRYRSLETHGFQHKVFNLVAFLHGELPFPDPFPVRSFNYLLLINISISGFLLVCGGVSDWDRTNNLQLRRLLLYPIELQRQYHKRLYQFLEFLARKGVTLKFVVGATS